jgi:hypothetical protein
VKDRSCGLRGAPLELGAEAGAEDNSVRGGRPGLDRERALDVPGRDVAELHEDVAQESARANLVLECRVELVLGQQTALDEHSSKPSPQARCRGFRAVGLDAALRTHDRQAALCAEQVDAAVKLAALVGDLALAGSEHVGRERVDPVLQPAAQRGDFALFSLEPLPLEFRHHRVVVPASGSPPRRFTHRRLAFRPKFLSAA